MKITKQIKIRDVLVGGGAPIAVQSMTNTDTRDAKATLAQIRALADAGCDIVRCAVPDMQAAEALREICANSPLPVVADIHFDYRLALAAIESGVDKIRLNPGNIGGADRVQAVVKAAKARHLPIRIGVNSGSVEKHILEKFGGPTPEAMVESALYHVGLLNDCDFDDICISIKSSSVPNTMQAYLLASEKTDYPLHLGVTEAGTEYMGTIKSAAGIGGLLALGVGDTIRVSLTDASGQGGLRGKGDSQGCRQSGRGHQRGFLPDLRPHAHQPHRHCQRGRAALPEHSRQEDEGSCYGLRGKRPGRSA